MNVPATRVWAAVAVVFGLLIVGGELASMMAAAQLRGVQPVAVILGQPLYLPWQWVIWLDAFGANLPVQLMAARNVGYGSIGLVTLFAIGFRLYSPREEKTTHGSARWATEQELREAGLGSGGVILCQSDDARYVCETRDGDEAKWVQKREGALYADNTDGHCLVTAYTRSGKGVGVCVPTGLAWLHSVIFYDLKKELWTLTAGWRSQFSRVWRWEPTADISVKFNSLYEVRRGDHDVGDAMGIANILCGTHEDSEGGGGGSNQHWKLTATDLITCAILHVLYAGERKSLAGVRELLTGGADSLPQEEILQRMIATPHLGDRPHPQVVLFATNGLNMAPNERSSVFSTANSHLGVFVDPIIARNTDDSDFTIKQLVELDEPVSLYLVVPPPDEMRMRPLVRLMFQQIGSGLMRELDARGAAAKRTFWQRIQDAFFPPTAPARWRHRLLMFVDEFPDLGRIPFFEKMMAKSAGYLIKLVLIAQSMSQIRAVYGANQSIQENCRVQLNYGANAYETAKYISDMFGQRTVSEERVSKSRKAGSLLNASYSTSVHEFARPLISPEDVMTLRYDRALLKVTGAPPGSCKKIMFYQDSRFRGRAGLPTPDTAEAQRAELPPRAQHGWDTPPIAHSEEMLKALKERRAKQQSAQTLPAAPIACTDAIAEDADDDGAYGADVSDGWVEGELPV